MALSSKFHKVQQEKRLAKAINLAGARYTPKLNVEVSIGSVFDGLGRTIKFYDQLKRPANNIIKNLRSLKEDEINKVIKTEFEIAQRLALAVANKLLKIPNSGVKKIDFKGLSSDANKAQKAVYKCARLLEEIERSEREKKKLEAASAQPTTTPKSEPIDSEKYRNETHYLYRVGSALNSFCDFAKSPTALASNNPRIVLKGIAGSGKTHFLCDLAKHRIGHGLPTFIFLGEEFNNKSPLDTIGGLLNTGVGNASFLTALNKYAATKRTRAILIVDAVNEAQVSGVHWESFNRIKNYKNLGVVLSVRSGFEQTEIPQSVQKSYVQVEHQGFAEHEWQALTKFFSEYKLPLPEVPILFPEFRIPLFLKIFCEASSKSPEPIKGHHGFTHIFEKYVIAQGESVLEKLGENGESVRRIWNGTIKRLALYMGENGTDRVPEKQAISIAAKEFPTRGKQVMNLLEKYWLITKVPRYKKYKIVGYDYRFPYQKFSDHLIVRNLLTKHLKTLSPELSFKKGTILGDIIATQWNVGLIEALSIQVPERLRGRELVYVAPKKFRLESVAKDSFLESLIWRDLSLKNGKPKYIKQKWVLNYINKYALRFHSGNEEVLETLLAVCAIPNHPLNAHLLHSHLGKQKMPKRDAFWLPFLNDRFGGEGAVNRLLAWAWDGGDKTKIQDESLELAGIALSWFLASSNRFLRDRTTKALVSMLNGRILSLIKILVAFKKVDDPYIRERLCAVAYGCVLQVGNKKEHVTKLALHLYDAYFKNGRPPTHILLRDYARGAIEVAITGDKALAKRIDMQKVRPPYGSSFPKKVPTLSELERKYPKHIGDRDKGYDSIWYSLMYGNGGGIADFGNYVVGSTLHHWCKLRLPKKGARRKTVKEMDTEFRENLSRKEKSQWKKLENMRHSVDWQLRMVNMPHVTGYELPESKFTKEELEAAEIHVQGLEKAFIESLNKAQQQLYKKGVLGYRKNPSGSDDIDNSLIQRMIFKRVVDLGWRPKLFGKFDSRVRDMDRGSHKSERIGKKYQWIGFHETLGRVADNFVFRGNWREDFLPYDGPWQMWERDIDPSYLLLKTPTDSTPKKPWWIGPVYKNWKPSITHTKWTKVKNDLPSQKRLIEVRARGGWLVLDGYLRWEQPAVAGEDDTKFDKIRRDVWYIARSYIVKRSDGDEVFKWAKKQNFMGRWMPDPMELRGIFLGEFPYSVAFQTEYNPSGKARWITLPNKENKATDFKAILTTEEYHWEGSSFDCSLEEGIMIHFPSKEIIKGMGLKQGKVTGTFIDSSGEIVAQDPSLVNVGSGVLLVKKKPFLEYLRKNGLQVIWAIMGEKLLLGTSGGGAGFLGRLEMGGAYRMKPNGKLEGKAYTKVLSPHSN